MPDATELFSASDSRYIPKYGITLTPEQYNMVKGLSVRAYDIDGNIYFPQKDKDGNITGYMMFLIWGA